MGSTASYFSFLFGLELYHNLLVPTNSGRKCIKSPRSCNGQLKAPAIGWIHGASVSPLVGFIAGGAPAPADASSLIPSPAPSIMILLIFTRV